MADKERCGPELAEEDESKLNDIVVEVDEAVKARSHFQKLWSEDEMIRSLRIKSGLVYGRILSPEHCGARYKSSSK